MALTLSEIQSISQDHWLPGSYNNWAMGNIMMYKMLSKAETIDSAEKVRVVLEHAKARGGAMGASTIFETAKKDTINAARFPWAYFWSGATIDIEDETQVSGGDADIDLVFTKLDNVQKTIRDIMGDSFWALYATSLTTYGADTKPFMGIADLVNQNDTTPLFGGIAKADLGTYTKDGSATNIWLALADATAYTMSFTLCKQLMRSCRVGNGVADKPDLLVTTEALKDALEVSLQASQRFANEDLVKAGFDNIKVGSRAAVVADDKCPASGLYAFNTEYLYLKAHKDFNFTPPVWKQPTNQYAKTCQIIWSGGFCTSQRRAHGVYSAVS